MGRRHWRARERVDEGGEEEGREGGREGERERGSLSLLEGRQDGWFRGSQADAEEQGNS